MTQAECMEMLDAMPAKEREELINLLHSIPEETKKKAIVFLRELAGEDAQCS